MITVTRERDFSLQGEDRTSRMRAEAGNDLVKTASELVISNLVGLKCRMDLKVICWGWT